VAIPAGTAEGDHDVEVSGRATNGAPVSSSRYFELGSSDIVTRLQPQVLDGTVVPAYVPARHSKQVMPIEVGAVVLVGLAAVGGATFAAVRPGPGRRRRRRRFVR
jgi:hypothetical protein